MCKANRNLYSMEKRRFRGDKVEMLKTLKGLTEVCTDEIFGKVTWDRTRKKVQKPWHARSRLDVWANFIFSKVVRIGKCCWSNRI